MTEQTANDYAAGWRPNPGERIKGNIVDIATGDGGYGPYPIVTLDTDDGEKAVHAFHQVLRTELARRRPKIGDEIEVTYLGKRENQSGNGSYHAYRVTGGQVQGYDWSQDLPEDQRQSSEPVSDIPSDLAPEPVVAGRASPPPAADDGEDLPF